MPLVDHFHVLKRVLLVGIAEHCAVTTDRLLACVAVVVQQRFVLRTHLFAAVALWAIILKRLNCVRDFFENTEIDQLRDS